MKHAKKLYKQAGFEEEFPKIFDRAISDFQKRPDVVEKLETLRTELLGEEK